VLINRKKTVNKVVQAVKSRGDLATIAVFDFI